MAWKVGSHYLGPGQTGRWWVKWPPPGDMGSQWIMAHPILNFGPVELVVTDHAKKLDYELGWVRSDGTTGCVWDSRYFCYLVTVRNIGDRAVVFSLEGGRV